MVYDEIDQGLCGNCWLLASIGSIMEETPGELLKMLPPERFSDENFNGKFTFNFFVHGKPTEVVIDDRLPTKDGELIFCGSKSNEAEFWPSLVEKAFAKGIGIIQVG